MAIKIRNPNYNLLLAFIIIVNNNKNISVNFQLTKEYVFLINNADRYKPWIENCGYNTTLAYLLVHPYIMKAFWSFSVENKEMISLIKQH